jgi:hypothetical protein
MLWKENGRQLWPSPGEPAPEETSNNVLKKPFAVWCISIAVGKFIKKYFAEVVAPADELTPRTVMRSTSADKPSVSTDNGLARADMPAVSTYNGVGAH